MMADLKNRFEYHKPDEAKAAMHTEVRTELHRLALLFEVIGLPEGREKSLAVTKLEEAMFWANAAIARSLTVAKPNPTAVDALEEAKQALNDGE